MIHSFDKSSSPTRIHFRINSRQDFVGNFIHDFQPIFIGECHMPIQTLDFGTKVPSANLTFRFYFCVVGHYKGKINFSFSITKLPISELKVEHYLFALSMIALLDAST